jgi:6-phosphogluconolactonase (cycloisomerase 2 family)
LAALAVGGVGALVGSAASADLLTFVEAEPMPAVADVQAVAVAVSPDGVHVYAAAGRGNALVVFERDAVTGALDLVQTLSNGVGGVAGLEFVASVAVSPDGAHVYTAATGDSTPTGMSSVAAFERDASTGELSFVEAVFDGSGGVVGLQGAHHVSLAPDGAHVYVAAASADAVLVFERDATSGELTFVRAVFDGQSGVDGLDGVLSVAVSPDGSNAYTAAFRDDAVAVFERNATTGELSFAQAIFDTDIGVDGLDGSNDITVSPDGAQVYSVSLQRFDDGENALVSFERDATTGELNWLDAQFDGVAGVDGLAEASSVVLLPTGRYVFVTGFGVPPDVPGGTGDNALAVFERTPSTGLVSFVEARFDGVDGVDGLEGARWADVSPDNAHVYVAGGFDAKVAVFALPQPEVPSLGPWGLGAAGLLLLLTAALAQRRGIEPVSGAREWRSAPPGSGT